MKRVRPAQGGGGFSAARTVNFNSRQNGLTMAKITIPIINKVGISLTMR
jgi:hypothetical protein